MLKTRNQYVLKGLGHSAVQKRAIKSKIDLG